MFTYYIAYKRIRNTKRYNVSVYQCLGNHVSLYAEEVAHDREDLSRMLAYLSAEYNTTDIREKSVTTEFYSKIARAQGILDTSAYRYVIINPYTVERIRREYLDTTAALRGEGLWEALEVK